MTVRHEAEAGIPTNIITGFLGVGKTSAILNLLEQKPDDERWALLINEFGEIGIDGSLLEGQTAGREGIYVREVPGGCMCCTAGLSMQIALAQLMSRARPHRLLIEPTGLGHPVEVLQTLQSEHYRGELSLQKTVTLVDARNLNDERFTGHATFRQQLEIADVVVANKSDLYGPSEIPALENYIAKHCLPGAEILVTEHGKISLAALEGSTATAVESTHATHGSADVTLAADVQLPESGILSAVNRGEGFESIGWRFSPERTFDQNKLLSFLNGLRVERAKAVFITGDGVFGYNRTRDTLTEVVLDDCTESRIEIIAEQINPDWESALCACVDRPNRADTGMASRRS